MEKFKRNISGVRKMRRLPRTIVLSVILLLGATFSCAPAPESTPESQPATGKQSIEEQIAGMSLEEKIGQMFMPIFSATYYNDDNAAFEEVARWIEDYHIGGLIMFGGDPYAGARNIYRFQKLSPRPLLMASDFEWGVPMRLSAGTRYPENMAIAAAGNPGYAYQQGVITAREAKALGIHITFSPALDINNNPDNPIINVRSYGEDPETVVKFGTEYIRGLQSEHVAATAKHFPGHGDTDVDSHLHLPAINAGRDRLDSLEFVPFVEAIEAGTKLIMSTHLALPELPSGNTPATLSPYILTDILRDSLGYEGVIVTDAMNMGGIVRGYWPGEAAVKAVQAGNDIVLFSPDFEMAYHAVLEAAREGRIAMESINASVKRILELKEWVNVDEVRYPDLAEVERILEDPENLQKAEKVFRESMTLVRDENKVLPMDAGQIDNLATIILTDNLRFGYPGRTFASSITSRVDRNRVISIGPQASDSVLTHAAEVIEKSDAVAVGVFVRFASFKGTINLPEQLGEFLTEVLKKEKPIVTVGFGSPYLLRYFPSARTYMVTYSTSYEVQRSAAAALFGEQAIEGKLPVSLPAGYEAGHGLEREPYTNVWTENLQPDRFDKVFDLIQEGIADSVAPGMAVYVAREGKVLAKQGFGRFTYDKSSPAVDSETIFDLASITKVMATTPLAMKMYERDYLHLDKPVSAYLPEFSGGMKDSVKVRHLLTHTAGLQPFIKFWEVADDPSEVYDIIVNSDLIYPPGDSTRYSDLGLILTGKIIEKLGRRPLGELVQLELYDPLGMDQTQYRPPERIWSQIAPTEFDRAYRDRQIQGEVHDENAAFMGGVAGHAGLFSTLDDMGRYAQMLLRNGYYDQMKHLRSSTIDRFTSRQNIVEGSTRALGWDTPRRKGSLYGKYFSEEAFGHTGYTGTSMIIDPKYDIIVILLTNRVYPSREQQKIYQFRPRFHNAVMEALLSEKELNATEKE